MAWGLEREMEQAFFTFFFPFPVQRSAEGAETCVCVCMASSTVLASPDSFA